MIFKEAPADFKKEIDVVACYVEFDGKFILLERLPHKTNAGKLGLPAGKVDAGESIEDAMCREIREETGIVVPKDTLKYLGELFVRNEGHDIHYHTFSTALDTEPVISISPSEHQSFVWISPSDSLNLNLIHDLDECTKLFYKL